MQGEQRVQEGMNSKNLSLATDRGPVPSTSPGDIPFTVQQAALFLG